MTQIISPWDAFYGALERQSKRKLPRKKLRDYKPPRYVFDRYRTVTLMSLKYSHVPVHLPLGSVYYPATRSIERAHTS